MTSNAPVPPVTVTPGQLVHKARGRKAADNPWVKYIGALPLDANGLSEALSFNSTTPKRDISQLKRAATVRGCGITVQVDKECVTFQLRPKQVIAE